mmetsp:Transcript_13599/g.27817  ORF Transcript_13599/g.27817 Transcript_13599/m.27817 type:complete len:304 (+) Transcript_13599:65-976(+)
MNPASNLLKTYMLLTSIILSSHINPSRAFRPTQHLISRMSTLPKSATSPSSSDDAAIDPLKVPPTTELSKSIKESYLDITGKLPDGVKLVPVSKTKPASYLIPILELEEGEREGLVFGENYMQELISKMELIPSYLPPHTRFAMIGKLQSNKINKLIKTGKDGKLVRIETITKPEQVTKISKAIDDSWGESPTPLELLIQIDTSSEDTKNGIPHTSSSLVNDLIEFIEGTGGVVFKGLMTIGAPGDDTAFDKLAELRGLIKEEHRGCELSMGMSGDWVKAVEKGSTEIRCGSNIFGARDYSKK